MHRVYAIRYGRHARTASQNFINPPANPERSMPMEYFIWVIVAPDGKATVVDTGFSAASAQRRGRETLRDPMQGLAMLGIGADAVEDVVITHLHYDHAGNTAAFPRARFWLQERELAFTTSRSMCRNFFRLAYEPEHVQAMVASLFQGRLSLIDGDVELGPGICLHWVGGHTAGLQVVRVMTESGPVVLVSDLFHYYDNFELQSPFPIVYRPDQMLEGFARVRSLVADPRYLVPGHDPLVMERFEVEPRDPEHTVQLWRPR
jgi:glyoxylase-like metal-dependent hydrolase (beta-lactamase superfamily II)